MGREFGSGLAGWLWFKVYHKTAVKVSSQNLIGAGGSTSKLSPMAIS